VTYYRGWFGEADDPAESSVWRGERGRDDGAEGGVDGAITSQAFKKGCFYVRIK